MFWMVRMFGATLILGFIASPEDVGFLSAALRILMAFHAFVWLYYFNLLPLLSRTWQQGSGAFGDLVDQSFRIVAWIGSILAVVWWSLAPAMILTVYGPAFVPAGTALQLFAVVCFVASLSCHYRYGLIVSGQQRFPTLRFRSLSISRTGCRIATTGG